jgi:hypothetical protein
MAWKGDDPGIIIVLQEHDHELNYLSIMMIYSWKKIYSYGSYSRYGMELNCPTFEPVHDLEMGFEKIVK